MFRCASPVKNAPMKRGFCKGFADGFSSLRLTVGLLALAIVLVLGATLDQANLGVWAMQEKYFRTFWVWWTVPGFPMVLPVFPGGYLVGGLLFLNLLVAQLRRGIFSWRKSGLLLVHAGLELLLIGELAAGLWQEEFQMRLDTGERRNFAESPRNYELSIVETTDPRWDDVVAIPEALLSGNVAIKHGRLPFSVVVREYRPGFAQNANGVGGERGVAAALVELVGKQGSPGSFLLSSEFSMPQAVRYDGREFSLSLRPARRYFDYSLMLIEFRHDCYPGTDIPRSFSSRVRLRSTDTKEDREVTISMNQPLRYRGHSFYQAGFDNNDRTAILQVVRNPGWILPYIACSLIFLGLLLQFGFALMGFLVRRRAAASA